MPINLSRVEVLDDDVVAGIGGKESGRSDMTSVISSVFNGNSGIDKSTERKIISDQMQAARDAQYGINEAAEHIPNLSDLQKQYDDFRASNKDFMDGYEKRNVGKYDNIPVYGAMGGLGPATFLFKTDSQKRDDERYNEIVRQGEKYKRAIDTHPDVVERRSLMLDRINQSVSDTDELIKGKMKNVPVFSRAYSGGLGVKSEDNNDREIKNLQMANKMYGDAEELLKAPSKYDDSNPFVNFLKGAGDAFNNRDFWSFGLTEIGRNMHMKKIVEKLSGNEEGKNVEDVLSPDELKMLDAFTLLGAVSAERANDLSLGYSAAQSSVESLKFMAEFLLTRGASGMASSAAKKAVSKWLVKNTARNGLARNLGKGLVWGTDATLSTLARTPLMPSTYANITDRMVGYDEDGMPVVKNVSDALLDGFVDSFIENLSEMSGAHVAGALGIGAKQAGKLVPRGLREGFDKALQSIDRSKLGSLRKAVFNPKVSAFLKETGYNGIGEEMLEEWYGNALRSVINDPDALKNFATWDNQLMTFFSFAPVALTGGVVSTVSNVRAENRYKNSVSALDKVLRELGADDNGVERFMNNLDGNGTEKDADSLNSLMSELAENDEKKGKELFAAMGEYLYSRSKYKVLNDGWREQMEAKKEAEDARLRDETGGYVNETTGQVDVVVDSEGNTGFITGETGEGEHKVYVVNVNGERVPVSNKDFNQEGGWQRVSSQDKDSFVEQAVMRSEAEEAANGEDYAGRAVLTDGQEVILQRTPEGFAGWTEDGRVIPVSEDMIAGRIADENMEVAPSEEGLQEGEVEQPSMPGQPVPEGVEQESKNDIQIPITEDGKPDYDSMTPEMFADEFEKEFGADAARGELEQMLADIDAQVEKLQKKSLTNRNERADNMREIARLKGEQESIRKALERYAVQEEGVQEESVRDDAPVFLSDEEEVLRSMAEQRDAERESDVSVSDEAEVDENGFPFVKASNGTTVFGEIRENSGLPPAPIKLSDGFQDKDGKGYGLKHIEANHGDQIRSAGFDSVEDFVAYVAQNYDEDNIRVGKRRSNVSPSYLLQVNDSHDNTLFVELSKDGSYWNVNSAGIFRKGYSNKKETVAKTEPQQPNNAVSGNSSLSVDENNGITSSEPNSESTVSDVKDSESSEEDQEKSRYVQFRYSDGGIHFGRVVGEERGKLMIEDDNGRVYRINENRILSEYAGEEEMRAAVSQKSIQDAEADVDVSPTQAQKDAGNYRKGHIKLDGYDITIENPKGSERSGVDADGNSWSTRVNNTYGYIRGTKGVDGDHIDVFLSDNPQGGNVYVVDQLKDDGSFDEHKVMYGFSSMDEARDAYLSNYSPGWKGLGAITEVSKNEFRKWVDSSKRKTKPFSEYKNVKVSDSARNLVEDEDGSVKKVEITDENIDKNSNFDENLSEDEVSKPISQGEHGAETSQDGGLEEVAVRFQEGGRAFQETDGGSEKAGAGVRTEPGPDAENRIAESYAKEKGTWKTLDEVTDLGDIGPSGNENDTYISPDGDIFKVNNLINSHGSVSEFVEKTRLHNQLFPETSYELVGFTGREGKSVYPIVKQRYVPNSMNATVDEIDNYMESLGFEKTGDYTYSNGVYEVSDLRPRNVLKDADGDIYVIDSEIRKEDVQSGKGTDEVPLFREVDSNAEEEQEIIDRAKKDSTYMKAPNGNSSNLSLGGEVEARNVERRINMTSEERRNSLASETEDVSREDQIFLNGALGVSQSMEGNSIDEVNRRFNEELEGLTEENADNVVLSLGNPNDMLRSAGISNKPMKLYGNKVIKKMKKHGFALSELKNLPNAVSNPIAVFDNLGRRGNRSILTELNTEQGNFLVTVDLGKDADVDFNVISSVFGKGDDNIVDWFNRGLATYIDKKKAISFLSHQSAPIAAAAANERLNSATNIVENFENPTLLDGEISSTIDGLSDELGVKVNKVKSRNDLPEGIQRQMKGGRYPGLFDPKTGEVSMDTSVDDVNRRFNEELDAFESDEHKGDLHLGMPGDVLLASGLNDTEMYITPKTLKDHLKKHGLSIGDIKNLPSALRNPLLVYEWGDKAKSLVVITNIEHDKGRITAAIKLERNGKRLEVNELASVHPKDNRRFINDMINAKRGGLKEALRYVSDKKKALDWLGLVPPKGTASLTKQELSIANIIKNYNNPTILDGEISSTIDGLSDELGVKVNKVKSRKDLPDGIQRQMKGGRYPGLFDPKTGEVYMVMDEITDVADAQATMLHEIVGHKGIRGLFGDRIGEFTKRVLDSMPEGEREAWVKKYNGNEQLAAEEYVARFAEGYENPGMWEKIKAVIRDLLRDLGIDLRLSDNDLKYTLWRGVRSMRQDGTLMGASEYVAKDGEMQRTLFREMNRKEFNGVDDVESMSKLMQNMVNQRTSVNLTSRLLSRYVKRVFNADMVNAMGKRQFDDVVNRLDAGIRSNFSGISKKAADAMKDRREFIRQYNEATDEKMRDYWNSRIKEKDMEINDVANQELNDVFRRISAVVVDVELKRQEDR